MLTWPQRWRSPPGWQTAPLGSAPPRRALAAPVLGTTACRARLALCLLSEDCFFTKPQAGNVGVQAVQRGAGSQPASQPQLHPQQAWALACWDRAAGSPPDPQLTSGTLKKLKKLSPGCSGLPGRSAEEPGVSALPGSQSMRVPAGSSTQVSKTLLLAITGLATDILEPNIPLIFSLDHASGSCMGPCRAELQHATHSPAVLPSPCWVPLGGPPPTHP